MSGRIDQFRNEINLLLICSQRISSGELSERVAPILEKDLDWDFLFRVSYRNGIFPLVFGNLLKASPDAIPDEVRSSVSSTLKEHTENNMFLTGQTLRILRRFASAGIPLLPFKGPLLSIQAFGDPGLRTYGDLDLLVQPKHLNEAITL
ncbi:MAG TPA: nucleotidyltransferase family protein, partial [Pyrinomonadaceae bacterium]